MSDGPKIIPGVVFVVDKEVIIDGKKAKILKPVRDVKFEYLKRPSYKIYKPRKQA